MLALLLSRGLDPNIAGDPGQSPLVIDTWDYAFCVAIRPKDRDCQNDGAGYYRKRVSMLLDFGADPNFIGNNPRGPRIPLVEAVRAGDFSLVKRMLSMGADPNKQGGRDETALMVAANMRNFEIMDFLLDNGADVDIKDDMGRTVVDREHYLSSKSSSRVVVHLLDNNRITNINAHALAYAAVGWRDSELLERVLSMGADANMRPPRGEYTPLISAIISKFSLGVEILLQHGASPTLPELDKDGEVGETPLEIAEKLRNARIIQLIRSYMDKEIRD
jgi:ankyrin repeat protein